MQSWWLALPERWAHEQQQLGAADIEFVVDEAAGPKVLALKLTMNWGGQRIDLEVSYPFNYPYFPPTVVAPGLNLRRHLHPLSKHLCLFEREGDDWRPGTDTLASVLMSQLPHIFASQAVTGPDGEALETHQGEPVTQFIEPEPESHIAFPEFDLAKLGSEGVFTLALEKWQPLRGTVIEVRDSDGRSAFKSEGRTENAYVNAPKLTGRWVALEQVPDAGDAKHFLTAAIEASAALEKPDWQQLPGSDAPRLDVLAVLFNDEHSWRKFSGNALVITRCMSKRPSSGLKKMAVQMHRTELESRDLYLIRTPNYVGLADSTVAMVGIGSLGSVVAKYLAQAGVSNLRLFDKDLLEAGNAVRWELGQDSPGCTKVAVLGRHIARHYPYTNVSGTTGKLGFASTSSSQALVDEKTYDHLFRGVDLIVDATASTRVNQYLSETAMALGIPYVWLHATNGAWGGLVGIARCHSESPCWMCHLYYLDEQDDSFPKLSSAPEDDSIQPPGCLEPTFTGAHVDLSEVALQAARSAIDLLLADKSQPCDSSWTCATVSLRDAHGRPILPLWRQYDLKIHPNCPNHSHILAAP